MVGITGWRGREGGDRRNSFSGIRTSAPAWGRRRVARGPHVRTGCGFQAGTRGGWNNARLPVWWWGLRTGTRAKASWESLAEAIRRIDTTLFSISPKKGREDALEAQGWRHGGAANSPASYSRCSARGWGPRVGPSGVGPGACGLGELFTEGPLKPSLHTRPAGPSRRVHSADMSALSTQ